MRSRIRLASTAIGMATLLVACGGGGGSSGTDGSALALSAANHVLASQEALATGLQFGETTELIVGAQVQRADERALLDHALAALRHAGPALASLPTLAAGVIVTSTQRCDNDGGSYQLAIDDANHNNRFDAGDTATFTFTQCMLDGDSANGKVAIRVLALTGDLNTAVYDGRFALTMTALSLTGASGSYTGNGQLDLDLTGTAERTGSSRVATSDFTSTSRFGNVQSTRTIRGFTVAGSFVPEGLGERHTLRFDGTLSSTGLGARSITVTNSQPFVVAAGARYPSQGQAIVAGAQGGTVRVTVIDATGVRLELDADGDGSYELVTTRPWSELL